MSPNDTEVSADKALSALINGDTDRASFFYQQILTTSPQDPFSTIGLGLSLAQRGDIKSSFETILKPFQHLSIEVNKLRARFADIARFNEAERQFHDAIYEQIWNRETLDRQPFYNIGPGGFVHHHWTNVDKFSDAYPAGEFKVDIEFDLMKRDPLAVADASSEGAYCSHVINLIREQDVAFLLTEMRRILRPGSVFRVTCINDELLYRAYLAGDEHAFRGLGDPSSTIGELFIGHVAAHRLPGTEPRVKKIDDDGLARLAGTLPFVEFLDTICSEIDVAYLDRMPCANITWWSFDKIERFLLEAGFSVVERSGMGQSLCPVMRDLTLFDDNSLNKVTLYVDAIA